MPIPSESLLAFEETVNRLAAESILAQVGRDEGLIPAFSLLAELVDLALGEQAIREPLQRVRDQLERRLDDAQPFDEASLAALRALVDWLPLALVATKDHDDIPPFAGGGTNATSSGAAPVAVAVDPHSAAEVDQVMDLNLEENRELLVEFHTEALDHLQQIEAALLTLDERPDDRDALNSIFRSFHTIKGVSGFLKLTPMHTLTHEVESLLDLARNNQLRLSSAIITEILNSRDAVQAMVQQITAALESGQIPKTAIRVSHLIRAVKHFVSGGSAAPADFAAPAPKAATGTPAPAATAAPATEILVPFPAAESAPSAAASGSPVAHESKASTNNAGPAPTGISATVRVNTEKLDSLMDVVGELVIVQSQLLESARSLGEDGSPLARNIAQLGRITKDLQHTSMSLRMVPVRPTFQKMERLARDLSKEFGKKIIFRVAGEDTEVDRTVVEEIGDPLVHMVRNALDHGLETAEQRAKTGKPEAGTVELKAYHQGSNMIIELSDDGRGIDPDKILAKAHSKGLIAPNVQLSRPEIFNLIFLPGFSTAEKVTSVSGRGVGMDVVKRNIEKLRGKIEIESEVGKGSIFRVKLPLTMAIIDGLVVKVGGDRFILPSTSVQMALRPVREAFSTVQGRGEIMDHRGKILPLHRLHRRFQIPNAIENPTEGIVVIVENGGRVNALLVDDMVSKQEVVIKNLGGFLSQISGVAGGAILGDGNIALILDPASLFEAA